MDNNPDIIEDLCAQILSLLKQGVPILEACDRADASVRAVYGGDRPYVKKNAKDKTIPSRDLAIIGAIKRGERIEFLARKHGISPRRVRQIRQITEK